MGVVDSRQLTSDHSPRTRSVGGMVLHHAAMTGGLQNLVNMMMPGGRTVSAHLAIKDGTAIQCVPFDRRAWSLGDAYWDSWACTCECVNSSANGWTLSAATHETIAQYVAEMSRRFGFYPHRNGNPRTWTALGHREVYTIHGGSYATACPGGMDLNWITKRAQQILSGSGAPAAIDDDADGTWAGYSITKIQQLLGKHGFPTDVDGIYGPDTTRQVKAFQAAKKLTVDGDVGPATWAALNGAAAAKPQPKPAGKPAATTAPAFPLPSSWYFGPKEGPIQSVSGFYGHGGDLKRWQQRMKDRGWILAVDGRYGPETAEVARAFQREKGLTVDGLIGPQTWAAAWTAPVT